MLSVFSSGHICACYFGLGHYHLDGANLRMQTHLVSKIMHQILAIISWQYNYSKNSFIVMVPACKSNHDIVLLIDRTYSNTAKSIHTISASKASFRRSNVTTFDVESSTTTTASSTRPRGRPTSTSRNVTTV